MLLKLQNTFHQYAINHSAIAPKEVPAGSKLFIYQIPDKELNANSEITDKKMEHSC